MPNPNVTVVVPVRNAGKDLKAIVRSLDTQDLPYERYRICFVDLGSSDGTRDRLADLVDHRPNVEVLTASDRSASWRAGAERADTEYTMLLDSGDRLQGWALPSLLDNAVSQRLDVLLGRTSGIGPIGFVPEVMYRPWRPDDPDAVAALLAPIALIRTGLLRETLADADAGWRASRVSLLAATSSIGILTDPPVGRGVGPSAGTPLEQVWRDADAAAQDLDGVVRARFIAAHAAASVRRGGQALTTHIDLIADVVRRHLKDTDISDLAPAHRGVVKALLGGDRISPDNATTATSATTSSNAWSGLKLDSKVSSATWQNGRLSLQLSVTVSTPAGPLPDGSGDVQPTLLIRKSASRETYELPATVKPSDENENHSRTFRVTTVLDLSTAAGGQPLTRGFWHPRVRLSGSGADLPLSEALPAVALPGAFVDGLPVKPFADEGRLHLDVGATKHGVFSRCRTSDVSIAESADGSLLTLRLPDLAVAGKTTLPGKFYQGRFALPATLRADADGARIECRVSGLAGVSRLSAEFPPAMKQTLGLRLRIGPAGDFAIESDATTKRTEKQAPPMKAPEGRAPTTKEASSTKAPAQKVPAKKAPAKNAVKPQKAPGAPKAATKSPTAKTYPAKASPSIAQRVLPVFKPVGRLLPKSARKKARRRYRKLMK